MRNKSIFLLLACVCGTIAAIGVSQWMQAQNVGQSDLKMVEIFVTTKAIDVAEQVTAEKIRLEQWPADRIPEGSTGNLADLEGRYAKQRFYAGEPVMPVKLMSDSNGNAATIPRGYSVVSMRSDTDSSAASLVRQGDRVDVMAYFTKGELIPETTAKTVLRGIRVYALDGKTERDEASDPAKPARNISLLIHKDDGIVWTYATELGRVRLQLCNPGDYTESDEGSGANPAGQEFLAWLADFQNAKDKEAASRNAPAPTETADANVPAATGFKMLKMSGGKVVEYEWIPGQALPRVSGDDAAMTATGAVAGPASPAAPVESDYSYLNGSESPFFQPPAGEKPVGGEQGQAAPFFFSEEN